MSFHWKTHGADEHCWYNLDSLVKLFPYTPESGYSHNIRDQKYRGPPGSRIVNENFQHPSPQTSISTENNKVFIEHDVPNVLNTPIVPIQWFWIELEVVGGAQAVDGVVEGREGAGALDGEVVCDGYGIEDGGAGALDVVGLVIDTELVPLFGTEEVSPQDVGQDVPSCVVG